MDANLRMKAVFARIGQYLQIHRQGLGHGVELVLWHGMKTVLFKAVGEHAPRGTVKLNIQPVAVQADLLHMKLFTAQQQGIYVCVQPAFAHLTHGVPLLPLRVTHALQGKGQRRNHHQRQGKHPGIHGRPSLLRGRVLAARQLFPMGNQTVHRVEVA